MAPDITVAMLVERTIARKSFWEFDFIIMQNLSYIFLLFWHQQGRLITRVHQRIQASWFWEFPYSFMKTPIPSSQNYFISSPLNPLTLSVSYNSMTFPKLSRTIYRVRTHLESTWKSLNLKIKIQGLKSPWKLQSVLESPWNLWIISSILDSRVPNMKIYATGRTVATHNSKKKQIKTIITTLRTSIKRRVHFPVLCYIHCSDWFNVCNSKSQWNVL